MSDVIVLRGPAAAAYHAMPPIFKPAFAHLVNGGLSLDAIAALVNDYGVQKASEVGAMYYREAQQAKRRECRRGAR